MKFVDEAKIIVQAGKGGAGCKSFRREKFVPYGGPDGGNGGAGGTVRVRANRGKRTLLDLRFRPQLKAEDGEAGAGRLKDGKAGADITIEVPPGTEIYRLPPEGTHQGQPIKVCDLTTDQEEFTLAKGGRGGKGNTFFKSSTNRAPEHFQAGEDGEAGEYLLSLKLMADVGLLGMPNAGKSTLISRISSARPKIAGYPFTTLEPNLGVVAAPGGSSFVVADIPGLIPGAHQGRGLGIQFLKHLQRTRALLHLIDPFGTDQNGEPLDAVEAFKLINKELSSFSSDLASKPQIVVLTKADLFTDPQIPLNLSRKFVDLGYRAMVISSASGQGLDELIKLVYSELGDKPGNIGSSSVEETLS